MIMIFFLTDCGFAIVSQGMKNTGGNLSVETNWDCKNVKANLSKT